VLTNIAGAAPGGLLEDLTDDAWWSGLNLKFLGYARMLRAVLPVMVRQGGGRVVNLIGNDGNKPYMGEIVPGAANAAGHNLTQALAEQYARHNILINAVRARSRPSVGTHSRRRWRATRVSPKSKFTRPRYAACLSDVSAHRRRSRPWCCSLRRS
jgi:NAD(P)-dependent dehydrogenase (short-subunit alcohol dehydrogenase family)